jgi:hypothetical protein
VLEVLVDLQSLLDDIVGADPLDMGDKADPAGIMFKLWIVQPRVGSNFHIIRHNFSGNFEIKATAQPRCRI